MFKESVKFSKLVTIWIPYKDYIVKNVIQTSNSLIFVF